MSFSFLGLTFHLYGLILGLAAVLGLYLGEKKAQEVGLEVRFFWRSAWVGLLGGLVGARFYHVVTHWGFYQAQPSAIFQVWRGGISIVGGILGGGLSLWLLCLTQARLFCVGRARSTNQVKLWKIFDVLVFALLPAQVVGRWANFFNQELFGLPTQLPWGIFIEPAHRPATYAQSTHFHPLFVYEMLLLLLLALVFWFGSNWGWLKRKKIGSGFHTIVYVFYYSFIRFWLDFIRINKTQFFNTFFSTTQVFLLGVMVIILVLLMMKKRNFKRRTFVRNLFLLLIFSLTAYFWFQPKAELKLNSDEVVWVLDGQYYQYRRQKNWSQFMLKKGSWLGGWSTPAYRLIDQPQLGKYFFGCLFSLFKIKPWSQSQGQNLYQDFVSMSLPQGQLHELEPELGPEVVSAIYLGRKAISVFGLFSITLFSFLVYYLTQDWLVGFIAYLLISAHPTFRLWYRLVVPNALQASFILLALGLMTLLLSAKKTYLKYQLKLFLWLITGVLVAMATSVKLNGAFLLLFPGFYLLVRLLYLLIRLLTGGFKQFFLNKKILLALQTLKDFFGYYLTMGFGFITTFLYLEPEIWLQPWLGLRALLQSRWLQQIKFRRYFQNYSLPETLFFFAQQFLKISPNLIGKIILVLFLAFGIYLVWKRAQSECIWQVVSALLIFLILSSVIYGDVGFVRYAEWPIYVFSFLTALGGGQAIRQLLERFWKG